MGGAIEYARRESMPTAPEECMEAHEEEYAVTPSAANMTSVSDEADDHVRTAA